MGTRLIIEGNAVYEIDEDCQREPKKCMEELKSQERRTGAPKEDKRDREPK